jgi:hypothetical protein
VSPFKPGSFRGPEQPNRFTFKTTLTCNHEIHAFRDHYGCDVATFCFIAYDPNRPPPAREKVLAACRALVNEHDVITDRGVEDDR